jgi:hypothetical protein
MLRICLAGSIKWLLRILLEQALEGVQGGVIGFGLILALLAVGAAGRSAAGVELEQAGEVTRVPGVPLPVLDGGLPGVKVVDLVLDLGALRGVGAEAGELAVNGNSVPGGAGNAAELLLGTAIYFVHYELHTPHSNAQGTCPNVPGAAL